ncbi:hypothetical protein SADUNF_Sadunf17G0110400 [Salix dunnii]|uniref:non-specific serine/threonine protein kinase n=1 Tax=Salix dunnii TaxID=1413687 RepID=A0A835JAZ3_9ROSI|nr:hypothetical protein SADUNF_Sadunf17G0110400 [Salix dunnii]
MHPLTTTTSFLLTLLFCHHLTTSAPSNDRNNLSNCSQTFSCGALTNVTYPFTGGLRPSHCGPPEFALTCDEDSVTILKDNSLSYRLTHLDQTSQTFRLSRSEFHEDSLCTLEHTNSTLNNSIFVIDPSHETLSLFYTCDNINNSIIASEPALGNFTFSCDIHGEKEEGFYVISNPYFEYSSHDTIECKTSIQVPVLGSQAKQLLFNGSLVGEVLKEGFDVRYIDPYSADCTRCYEKHPGGYCGFDARLGKPVCICNDLLCPGKQKSLVFMSLVKLTGEIDERRLFFARVLCSLCPFKANGVISWIRQYDPLLVHEMLRKSKKRGPLVIGLSTGSVVVIGLFFGCCVLFIVQRRKRKSAAQVKSKGLPVATPPSSKGPATSTNLSQTTSFLTSSKSSLEKGSVLKDGRVVAVKRLFENNMRRAEQFMNEIEILAHLRHKNLVILHGLDTNRHRHDINLSNMAVNKIQNHALNELVDPFLGFDKNPEVRRMVTSVAELAFRCLQQDREMRPSMEEVLEALKRVEKENYDAGNAEVLDIRADDVGLLKHAPPPAQLSPDSLPDQFWASSSSTITPHSY